MDSPPARLIVARLRKPHGLKGEVTVFPLTDDPAGVFTPGRALTMVGLDGAPIGDLVVDQGRPYHREWLLKFRGVDHRDRFDGVRDVLLTAAAEELTPPAEGEVYLHELVGFALMDGEGGALGVVSDVLELPAGVTLEVQGPKREFLLPYRKEFIRRVERAERRLVVELPEGCSRPDNAD